MSRHFDRAMTKLTSKEKEAIRERCLRRALEEGIRALGGNAPASLQELDRALHAGGDPDRLLARILSEASQLEAENAALQQRLRHLEGRRAAG